MKNIVKGSEPDTLISYRENNPQGSWENCKRNKNRREKIQKRLLEDQGGLCAYCEVDLKTGVENSDFRVEHFHPKSDSSTQHNWHLDWGNLLACCHGGSQRDVVDAERRFSSPDHSCDVPKDNDNLTGLILNPLELSAYPCIFKYTRDTGEIKVHIEQCDIAGVNKAIAQQTIDKLRLDSERLKRLRKPVLNKVNDELRNLIAQGLTLNAAQERLAQAYFYKNSDGHWPAFFSAIRHYLGSAAEERLRLINYSG